MKITIEDVTVEINSEPVLDKVRLELEGPGLVQILGPNGAGKTTLIRTILGLTRPKQGRITINGRDVTGNPREAGRHAAYVPQRPPLSPWNPMTAWDLVYSRLLFEKPWPRLSSKEARARAEQFLQLAGVPREAWYRRLHELSGGELMRVFIARALALGRSILLLDEPLAPVDPRGRIEIARLLGGLARDRLVVVSSHDPELLLEYTRRIILLNRRVVAEGEPGEVLRGEVLSRVYGGSVLLRESHYHIVDHH